jgi:hypothetical protein
MVTSLGGPRRIALKEEEAEYALATSGNPDSAKLIPMPRIPGNVGFQQAFFSPLVTDGGGSTRVAFEVVVIARGNILPYRFEQAMRSGTHTYDHVQMSREILGRTYTIDKVPDWLPTRYPAHPLPSRDALGLFLCVLTSMHGYRGGSQEIVRDVLVKEHRSADAMRYLRRLDALFGDDD